MPILVKVTHGEGCGAAILDQCRLRRTTNWWAFSAVVAAGYYKEKVLAGAKRAKVIVDSRCVFSSSDGKQRPAPKSRASKVQRHDSGDRKRAVEDKIRSSEMLA